jgi:hypothetical protein
VDNGAVHALGSGIVLGTAGTSLDTDSDGQPTGFADGDDTDGNNDDDGVTFASGINPGSNATVDVTASSACSSVTCYLNAWMDFDGDGTWDDTGEQIFTDQAVTADVTTGELAFVVPAATAGSAVATWDGADKAPETLAATGLGAADLTDGGAHDALSLSVVAAPGAPERPSRT